MGGVVGEGRRDGGVSKAITKVEKEDKDKDEVK